MADLLDDDFRLAAKDILYRSHGHLLVHREALFTHLKDCWARLKELQKRDKPTRDELLLAIGAAKHKAGRNDHRHVIHHLPATDGRGLRMKRHTKPEKVHQLLLDQLGFTLPAQPSPKSEIQRLWWRPFEKMNATSTIRIRNTH